MKTKKYNPKVSICIPTFNQIYLLKKVYDSILLQDYHDYEVVVTDDSDNDETERFTKKYKNKFGNRLKYFKNKTQLGSPQNWNECIKKASGEYIKILHHDDWFIEVDSLRRFVNLLDENPKATVGFVSTANIDTVTGILRYINNPSEYWIEMIENIPEILIFNNFIGPPSATIFRILNPEFRFDFNLIWVVDLDGYVQLLKFKNAKLAYDPKVSIAIGISNLQVTRRCENDKQINLFEFFFFLRKWKINDVKINELIQCKTEHLFEKFDIKNVGELKNLGISWRLPKNVQSLIKEIA